MKKIAATIVTTFATTFITSIVMVGILALGARFASREAEMLRAHGLKFVFCLLGVWLIVCYLIAALVGLARSRIEKLLNRE